MRRIGLLASLLVLPLLGAPATATSYPSQIWLPDDFQPEGITIGPGDTFYVGSLRDGDIFRGDLSAGEGSLWIDVSDRAAVGLQADVARNRLWVSGGATGRAFVYDLTTGEEVADLVLDAPGALVNDVAVTERAVYFTSTLAPRIYKVPIGKDGAIGTPSTITVTGPASAVGGFGLNGIKASADGSVLVVNHTALGILATVDPATGESAEIDLGSDSLIPDTADGLILRGHTAWVVENFANTLVEVKLSPDWSSGVVVSRTTDPLFRVPTTVAAHGSRFALVNGRFDLGFPPPFGPGAPPGTDFDVVVIDRP